MTETPRYTVETWQSDFHEFTKSVCDGGKPLDLPKIARILNAVDRYVKDFWVQRARQENGDDVDLPSLDEIEEAMK